MEIVGTYPVCILGAKGLLELKRFWFWLPKPLCIGGVKLSGSDAKPGAGGASSTRASGKSGSEFWSVIVSGHESMVHTSDIELA